MAAIIQDNLALHRFELRDEAGTAYVDYQRSPGLLTLIHTVVPPALAGHGVGSALAHHVLGLARAAGDKVDPQCRFVAAYIQKHPEYRDLVAARPAS